MTAVQDYLYEMGWYTQSFYIEQKCFSFCQVEKYLIDHCYDTKESRRIVKYLKRKTMTWL